MMGRTAAAAEHLTYAWKLYEPARHRKLASVVSQEPGVSVAVFSALCLGSCGLIDQAYSRADMALSMAKASRHPMTIAYAQGHMTMLWLMLRDAERASALLDETLTYSETNSIKVWHVWSRAWQVPLRSLNGRFEEAVATIDELRPVLESTGTLLYQPLILSGELQALLTLGRLAECEERLRQLYAWIEKSGEAWNLSDIHRLEGGLRLAQNDPAAAEHCYRVAIDVASQQGTKLYELRASHDLAQLLAEQGERQKAHDLLFPVYDGFTEGFGAADLTEAKRLLDEL
jgi:predicted ATPase